MEELLLQMTNRRDFLRNTGAAAGLLALTASPFAAFAKEEMVQLTILHTNDGGVNWESEFSATNSQLYSVHFRTPSSCWIVGNNGNLLTLDSTVVLTGLNSDYFEKRKIFLFPNPVSTIMNIKTSYEINKTVTIEIFNCLGQLEFSDKRTNYGNILINIENLQLKKGIHFVIIKGGTFFANEKFLVE